MTISEQIETARRERRVLARVCRAAWRLEQAGRERAWALPPALAEGVPIRPLADAWLVRKVQFATMNMLSNSGNRLLVLGCERSVSGTHRNPAAEGGGPAVAPAVTGSTGLARARQRFLAAQPLEPGLVRDTILASWQRSRRWNVAAGHIDPCYVRDPGPGTPLTRSALGEGLEGQPVSVILTDARGVVL